MYPYIAEFIGTTMLVFMGDGVNAANSLEGSFFRSSGAVFSMMGEALAVALPAMCFNSASGAFFNPSLTIGYAVIGALEWKFVPGYVIAQMLGGFTGACAMWFFYRDLFDRTDDPNVILSVFCTGPAILNIALCLFNETIGTMVFVTYLLNIPTVAANLGINFFYVFMVIMSIGYSLGATTGFAMNPARDFSPRLAHALLPIPNKGSSNWSYSLIPVIGPLIGGILGALFGNWVLHFPPL